MEGDEETETEVGQTVAVSQNTSPFKDSTSLIKASQSCVQHLDKTSTLEEQ